MKKIILALILMASASFAFVAVYTEAFSNLRLQWNPQEISLNSSTVVSGKFGMLGSYVTSDWVYAHPLYAPNVIVGGIPRNLLIVADMSDFIYAFDADRPGQAFLWRTQVGTPAPYPYFTVFYTGENLGCLSTPVIDAVNGWLFEVCSNNGTSYLLAKLNLLTGAIISSTTVSASVTGTGDPNGGDCVSGGVVSFCVTTVNRLLFRPGLTLANSNVYISSGGVDQPPWHGWIMGYSESALSQIGVFMTTPNGEGGSIWQSSGGPAVDASGNIYVTTGNGDYNGTANYSMSVLKLSPTLALLDWFTPSNYAALSSADADTSSGPPFLPTSNLVVVGFKDWNAYAINNTCMGHLGGTVGCTAPQIFAMPNQGTPGASTGIFGRMFMNGLAYFCTQSGPVYSYALTGTTFNATPVADTTASFNTHGLMMAGSSNGGAGNLVWGLSPIGSNFSSPSNGVLHAFDATTLTELWNSQTIPADNLGALPKFQVPLIANGRVYVGGQNTVAAFGFPLSTQLGGSMTIGGNTSIH
jgi:hypothetical protein